VGIIDLFWFKNQICNGGPGTGSMVEPRNRIERCLYCFEVCSIEHAEIAVFECPSCMEVYGHMHCIIKRTSQRQRKQLQAGTACEPPVRCPRVVETGVCGCPLERLRILKENDTLRSGRKSSETFTLHCRGFPPELSSNQLEIYFQVYGSCKCLVIKSEFDEVPEAYITFDRIDSLISALDERHTFDGQTELDVESMHDISRHRKNHNAQLGLIRPENCVLVGPLPDQISESALYRYFEDFGAVMKVEKPSKTRGFAHVYFLESNDVRTVLRFGAHTVDGVPVVIKRAQPTAKEGYSRGSKGSRHVNSASPWKIAQASNSRLLDPYVARKDDSVAQGQSPSSVHASDSDEDEDELEIALRESLALATVHAAEEDEDPELRRALQESAEECRVKPIYGNAVWPDAASIGEGGNQRHFPGESEIDSRRHWQGDGLPFQSALYETGGACGVVGKPARSHTCDGAPGRTPPVSQNNPVRRYEPRAVMGPASPRGSATGAAAAAVRKSRTAPYSQGLACGGGGGGLGLAGGSGAEDCGGVDSAGLDDEGRELLSLLLASGAHGAMPAHELGSVSVRDAGHPGRGGQTIGAGGAL
jgi:hypothetical protein